MTRAYLAFTDTGLALARRLADALPGSVDRCGSGGVSLAGWTALQFAQSDALVFVGAVGIAVRAIAPHCRSKASDPAVVVLDECGRFAVPVLSGHLGGANDLARALAAVCGAVPVITTATDAHGIFAVDEWAKHQNCTVLEAERIKHVSSKLLAGQSVRFAAEFPVQGTPPAGVDPARTPAEADFALIFSVIGKISALLRSIPSAVLGGIMLLLFGTIACAGIGNLVNNCIDLSRTRNIIIVSLTLTVGIGGAAFNWGDFSLSGIGLAALVGVVLNLILPRED